MNKTLQFFIAGIIILVAIWVAGYTKNLTTNPLPKVPAVTIPKLSDLLPAPTPAPVPSIFVMPLSNAKSRVTKKLFGTYVTPKSSPITPERFKGYHTGVDFETTPAEQNSDVVVYAICPGKLIMKKTATGYGGVVVESCVLEKAPITVIYGHLKLDSVNFAIGTTLKAGDKLGVLGKGYSSETDGERKHLHLGIHRGSNVNLLGYVSKTSDLANWIDFANYLK